MSDSPPARQSARDGTPQIMQLVRRRWRKSHDARLKVPLFDHLEFLIGAHST